MREIKFRAWDGQDTMIYFDFNSIKHDGLIDWNENKYSDTGGGLYIANCGVMQYTGLQDKTGRDIFEGDILYNNKANWEVGFDEGGYWMRQREGQHKFIFINEAQHSEIIGNIYENLELLEEVEEIPVMEGTREALDKLMI